MCKLLLGWHPAAVTQYTFTHKLYVNVLIHLLTAVGLTTCGSNTVHFYTQTLRWCVGTFVNCSWVDTLGSNTVHIYTQSVFWCIDTFVNCSWVDTLQHCHSTHLHTMCTYNNKIKFWRVRAVPLLCELYNGIALRTEENHGKTSLSVAEECKLARWK